MEMTALWVQAVRAGSAGINTLGVCRPRSPRSIRINADGQLESNSSNERGDNYEEFDTVGRRRNPGYNLGYRGRQRGRSPASLSP